MTQVEQTGRLVAENFTAIDGFHRRDRNDRGDVMGALFSVLVASAQLFANTIPLAGRRDRYQDQRRSLKTASVAGAQ
jgi:hypothetical protein